MNNFVGKFFLSLTIRGKLEKTMQNVFLLHARQTLPLKEAEEEEKGVSGSKRYSDKRKEERLRREREKQERLLRKQNGEKEGEEKAGEKKKEEEVGKKNKEEEREEKEEGENQRWVGEVGRRSFKQD